MQRPQHTSAKRRLADEYDAAQEGGEVVGAHDGAKNRVPKENAIPAVTELGLTRKDNPRGADHPRCGGG